MYLRDRRSEDTKSKRIFIRAYWFCDYSGSKSSWHLWCNFKLPYVAVNIPCCPGHARVTSSSSKFSSGGSPTMLLNFDLMHFTESWINCNKVAIPKWLLDIPQQQNLDWRGGVTLTPEINVAEWNLVLRDVTRMRKSNVTMIFLYAFILVGSWPVEIKACLILSVCTEGSRRATTNDFERWITVDYLTNSLVAVSGDHFQQLLRLFTKFETV